MILPGDKDKSITIMNKVDYRQKVQQMINEGISQGKYAETDDTILKYLGTFILLALNLFCPDVLLIMRDIKI